MHQFVVKDFSLDISLDKKISGKLFKNGSPRFSMVFCIALNEVN